MAMHSMTILIRQVWLVVAKLIAECIQFPEHISSTVDGLKFAVVVISKMRAGEPHECGRAVPDTWPDGVLARVSVILQMMGCSLGGMQLADPSWTNVVVLSQEEAEIVYALSLIRWTRHASS